MPRCTECGAKVWMPGTICSDCLVKDVKKPASANNAAQQASAPNTEPTDSGNNGPYEGAELSEEGRRTMSASALVRLLIGVVLMAIGLVFLGGAVDGGESTIFELFAGLVGLAFIAPGVLLIFSSLFGIKKSGKADLPVDRDNAESPGMKFAKGCGVVTLIILVGLVGLVALLANAISG